MSSLLNFSQHQAVESSAQSLLIVAGPGTGKTHTLTHRIVRHAEQISQPQKIVAITFTRKAAQEMRERLERYAAKEVDKVFVGTFHQFCISVLKKYQKNNFTIASEDDCIKVVTQLWPDDKTSDIKKRLDKISQYKSVDFREETPEDVAKYEQMLREKQLYDFDDLILETVRLMESQPALLQELRRVYTHVFVDEYQDLNPIQHELLKLLAGKTGKITAIGDPDQAIYGFRGSDVRFFHAFVNDFNEAEILYLRDNYRNAKDLLTASAQIMAQHDRADDLRQVAQIYDQGLLTVHESLTDKAEAEYVVHSMEQLIGGTSMFSQDSGRVVGSVQDGEISFGDIAVLYRLKSQARELKKSLERSGMPFYVVGDVSGDENIEEDLMMSCPPEPDIKSEKISLMTLHAAKGLEFPCVFICGCEEGLLPLSIFGMLSDTEEERRLLYVGMTRAKQRLYLTHAKKRMLYGKKFQHSPTTFLADIEESLKNHSKSHRKKKVDIDDGQMTLF